MKVVVVGTGIVGASAAYYFVKNGVEVVMVDRAEDGKATSAGAGIVCPWISSVDDPNWYQIAKRGARFYPNLIQQLIEDGETETGYKKVGALSVSTDQAKLDEIEERVKQKKIEAPEVGDIRRLNSEEAQAMFPALSNELEAVYVSGAARIDGSYLRDALKRASQKHGARLIEGEARLVTSEKAITGVEVNEETIYADKVLITAGAWAPELLKPLGLELDLEPQRGQIAHINLPGQDTSNWPVVLPHTSHYMLAFDDFRVVAGATRETGSGFDYRLTAGGVHNVLGAALDVAPGLNEGTLKEVRIGFRPMGPDILPLVGQVDAIEGLFMANGLGASGLTMGPYVGTLAAGLMTGEEVELDMNPYQPMRAISVKETI
ncbi:NAD(P)/FAD-dependent oxidoreductase [Oceanobacillus kapialis]|uniref:NAD(P)/FAD-dependent oxidoreductase n=1 Tax=Oceanobacillus kapialis TaxID=481353 RepID=UPI00384E13AB